MWGRGVVIFITNQLMASLDHTGKKHCIPKTEFSRNIWFTCVDIDSILSKGECVEIISSTISNNQYQPYASNEMFESAIVIDIIYINTVNDMFFAC